MAKKFILILGGARSGKSTFAQSLAKRLGEKVLFVATGEPLDEEMVARIEKHKRARPENWCTLEIDVKVAQSLEGWIGDADVVLLDCLTLLVSNVLTKAQEADFAEAEKQVMAEMEELISVANKYESNFIVVSNEVGLGLVPENKLGRIYRDLLGKANQLLAEHASEVYFMAAGIPIKIKESS